MKAVPTPRRRLAAVARGVEAPSGAGATPGTTVSGTRAVRAAEIRAVASQAGGGGLHPRPRQVAGPPGRPLHSPTQPHSRENPFGAVAPLFDKSVFE